MVTAMDSSVKDTDQESLSTRTGTDLFTSRRHDVFSGLGELEKKHSAFLKVLSKDGSMEDQGLVKLDPEEENAEGSRKPSSSPHRRARQNLGDTRDSDFRVASRESKVANMGQSGSNRTQDSGFKHPMRRPYHRSGRNQLPDFKKHPEKYTHYSLGDVSENDMSERSNSKAALAFLEERRSQKEKEEKEEEIVFDTEQAACSQGHIAFSRPSQKKSTDVGEHEKGDRVQVSSATSSVIPNLYDPDTDILQEENLINGTADTENESHEGKTPIHSFKSRKSNSTKRNYIRKKSHDVDSD
ncbi:hypothetical protein EGW08_012532 [Elysia chlorotica]|uniref:U5 small nuclear ribonucleoprotein TSSC4 n=1 Tax=Elysia chlorotica TaxID=188477 RepID=A0A3S1BBN5_ELYCH|nr:hypothetical protein EGW08_012532 [Elysia chlorotica]